jgi:cellulose synthase/poly-beta-1,6-N-acetylglucosamine synthase-like glycosyltransferase
MKTEVFVSILIAVRNEEMNLNRLLASLENLNYPKELLQVIIADDESTDLSLEILSEFAKSRSWLKVFNISEIKIEINLPKGKMRALAAIEQHAKGEYLLFTDADIALPRTWINGMLAGFGDNTGIINGITGVKNTSFLARMQNMEWLIALYIMHINAGWGFASTGMGNNMGISRKAFDAVGGFSGIGFSIVEDYAIYKAVLAKGFGFNHLFNTAVLAETLPPENYFEQRKRWMKGAFSSDSYLLYLSIGQAIFFPIFLLLAFYSPISSLILFLIQIFIITYLSIKINDRLLNKFKAFDVIWFVFYISLTSLVLLLYHFFGKNVIWKGRTYI